MVYEVQQLTIADGWTNTFTHEQDGSHEPMQFKTRKAALRELNDYIDDCLFAYRTGYLEDYPDHVHQLRIVKVE